MFDVQLRSLPEDFICETPEFKCIQSRYTALVNESVHLRHQLSETRELIKYTKAVYDQQFEKIEVKLTSIFASECFSLVVLKQEELENQRKLRATIEQVATDLAESKREYGLLQVEYEKVLISNQQSGSEKRSPMISSKKTNIFLSMFKFQSNEKCEV